MEEHIQYLQPKADYVVFNAGLWPHDLNDINLLHDIQAVFTKTNITSIYKTTTAQIDESEQSLSDKFDSFEQPACHTIFDHCINLNWTTQISGPEYYWDNHHFEAIVNQMFNEQMLELLQSIWTTFICAVWVGVGNKLMR